MNISSSLVANPQSAKTSSPGMGALDHPAVLAKAVFGLNSSSSNTWLDTASPTALATPGIVIPLVRMQFGGPEPRSTSRARDGMNRIEQLFENPRVVDVSRGQHHTERNAVAIDKKMMFRARFALVRWVGPCFFAPFLAATVAGSTEARLQSISPALPSFSRNTWCRRFQTPFACHSSRRRQQVIPLPQPISRGSISKPMPLRRMKRIPVNTARSGIRGLPPLGLGFSGGNKGAIASHNSSSMRGRISHPRITRDRFC